MAKGFNPKPKEDIRQFYEDTFVLTRAEFEGDEADTLVKQALVMVEGEHTDSAKRRHIFDRARVQELVENTNAFIESGGRVPWQRDHRKDQDANIGDLEGLLELRVITPKDVPDERLLKRLVGKVGAFATRLVAKGRDVVQQIKSGRIITLSPGIDVTTNTIREISATPTPAIVGLRTFKRAQPAIYNSQFAIRNSEPIANCELRTANCANFALTFEEAEMEQADINEFKEKYNELTDRFWNIIVSITQSPGEELQGQDPVDLQYEAINGLAERLIKMLELDVAADSSPSNDASRPNVLQNRGVPMPKYLRSVEGGSFPPRTSLQNQQQDVPPGGQANMSAYTMADMAKLMYGGQGGNAEFARRRGRRRGGRRKSGGLAGAVLGRTTAGRLARVAGLGLGGAALRYGGAGVGYAQTFQRGQGIKPLNALRKTARGAGVQAISDARNIRYEIGRGIAAGTGAVSELGRVSSAFPRSRRSAPPASGRRRSR